MLARALPTSPCMSTLCLRGTGRSERGYRRDYPALWALVAITVARTWSAIGVGLDERAAPHIPPSSPGVRWTFSLAPHARCHRSSRNCRHRSGGSARSRFRGLRSSLSLPIGPLLPERIGEADYTVKRCLLVLSWTSAVSASPGASNSTSPTLHPR
jgi:hypothetical protein